MSAPCVTVLLPAHQAARTLSASLESVWRQTFRDFELLAIDDGSTDDTPAILRACADPRLRVLRHERNLGLTPTLNRGLREARGEWIARLDADDLCDPRRIEQQLAFLRAHPDVQLLGTSAWRIDAAGRVTGANDLPLSPAGIRWAGVWDSPFLHPSVVFRRAVVLELGGYDEQFAVCQDYDLWTRLAAGHRVANLPERLVFMREHAASMTRTQPDRTSAEIARMLEANLAAAFPGREFSAEEKRLIGLARLRFDVAELPAVSALVDRLGRTDSPDLRAALCRLHLRLGYKFLGTARGAAAGQIARAFRHSPREWCRQAAVTARCVSGLAPALPV